MENQVNSGVRNNVPWMQTDNGLKEYQAPDRTRIVTYATEYVRDVDGDGTFEEVVEGASCEIDEAVTIAATFYQRCDDAGWDVMPLSRPYALPVQTAGDLLNTVHELDDLQVIPNETIDGREMYVFRGAIPGLPPDLYEATRTVWVDQETALIRRVVEVIRWEEPSGDEPPDTVNTQDYVDYNIVTIAEPETTP